MESEFIQKTGTAIQDICDFSFDSEISVPFTLLLASCCSLVRGVAGGGWFCSLRNHLRCRLWVQGIGHVLLGLYFVGISFA